MTTNDSLLREGIAAVKLGQRERARTILMQVVADDERNEQGWLWLSAVVDEPADQRVCLQNVLDINPRSPQAQKGLAWLDAHHPIASPGLPVDSAPAVPAPIEEVAPVVPPALRAEDIPIPAGPLPNVDNPCPYCGSPTRLGQNRCVQCKNSLMVRDTPSQSRSFATGILAILWVLSGLLTLFGTLFLAVLIYSDFEPLRQARSAPELASVIANGPVWIAAIALIGLLSFFVAAGLWQRRRWAYITHVVLTILSIFQNIAQIGRQPTPLSGAARSQVPAQVAAQITTFTFVCSAILLVLLIVLTILSYGDFFGKMVRVLTIVPDRDDADHYNMGVTYKDRGMWYMATKEWEGAVRQRPSDANYRRALGLAYAQIHQLGRGVRELREAVRLRTSDQAIQDDLTLVEQMALKEMNAS